VERTGRTQRAIIEHRVGPPFTKAFAAVLSSRRRKLFPFERFERIERLERLEDYSVLARSSFLGSAAPLTFPRVATTTRITPTTPPFQRTIDPARSAKTCIGKWRKLRVAQASASRDRPPFVREITRRPGSFWRETKY